MEAFAVRSMEALFEFSWLQFLVVFLMSVLIGVVLGVAVEWYIGLAVGGGLFILQYIFLGNTFSSSPIIPACADIWTLLHMCLNFF